MELSGTIRTRPSCGDARAVLLPHRKDRGLLGSAGDAGQAQGVEAQAGATRVLLVEDDPDFSSLMSDVLVQAGYCVQCASDGRAALKLAAEFRPRVAVIDIGLPTMDGLELGRRLRADPRHASLVLVCATARSDAEARSRAYKAGFVLHVTKPFGPEKLLPVLHAASAAGRPKS